MSKLRKEFRAYLTTLKTKEPDIFLPGGQYSAARREYAFYLAVRQNMKFTEIGRRLGVVGMHAKSLAFKHGRYDIGLPYDELHEVLYRSPTYLARFGYV